MTTPPPNVSDRLSTSSTPASRQAPRSRSSGQVPQKSLTLSPRKPQTSAQPGEMSRPAVGRPTPTYASPDGTDEGVLRQPELEARDRPAGPDDSSQLGKGRCGIVHVAEEVRERERVERARPRKAAGPRRRGRARPRAGLARVPPRASPRSGRARPHGSPCGVRARSRPCPCPWRRPARCRPGLRPCARRGSSASGRPARTRAAARSGRTSAQAARTGRSRAVGARRPRPRPESKLTS